MYANPGPAPVQNCGAPTTMSGRPSWLTSPALETAQPKESPAVARLGRDQARLNVLLAAVDEVRDSVGRVAAFYPRK